MSKRVTERDVVVADPARSGCPPLYLSISSSPRAFVEYNGVVLGGTLVILSFLFRNLGWDLAVNRYSSSHDRFEVEDELERG
jgi:hypothetical protein